MSIKKVFFAPLASGLGATRRAAVLLLVMMLTATTAWADNVNVATADNFGTLTDGKYTLTNGNTYTLTGNVNTAGYIHVPTGVTATIDLAGHTIDRGLTRAVANGSVILVEGTLTLSDSSTGGTVKGGMDNSFDHASCVNVQEGGTFTLTGGTIIGNTSFEGNSAVFGDYPSSITMTGGKITGDACGIKTSGDLTISGGEISGNSQVGVKPLNHNMSISGNPRITDNGHLNINYSFNGLSRLIITGALTEGANIGIQSNGTPSADAPVTVTSGYGTYNTASPGTYFSLDDNSLVLGWNEDRTEVAVGTALYTVGFNMNGHGTAIDAVSLLSGYKVAEPTEPTADDWFFIGWFVDDACTAQWNFDNGVTSNMTLHALWTQEAIYSFTLPDKMVIVSTTNAPVGGKYPFGTVIKFKVSSADYVVDGDVKNGDDVLTADGDGIYTVTVGETDITITATVKKAVEPNKTLSGSESYTAQDGDVLTGSTSGTVTIASGASITLSGVTINGGIICQGTATITLVGTNSVSGETFKAGIQVGGSGTTLTIKGNGSLTANGGNQSAGIGLSRAWDVDATGGDIVIEGGTIIANGSVNSQWGAGIGTGVIKGGKTASLGNITIKGGTVKATGGSDSDGIGTGYTYGGCTNTIGTVTIYDGINMVDASSIKDIGSVVYMHGETEVTANKADYFTIVEDGDCRIIVPKDDTDYTITIADGIQHGTLAAATTAKYCEKVTITVTPYLGYRFVRLVVKDAKNNYVASTGNTFLMPKGNVTVSAVFEQGTHGTTELKLMYSTGAHEEHYESIYDGVTTVNLQKGRSYKIQKDQSSYRRFLLDNNNTATIPYSGGTGTFQNGNGTGFSINYDGESGYYDITMTDVGDGKWSVSILKTVGQMDVVPEQTYTGSAITPEPTVIAGSLSLTKGTDYVYSYENNENVGTAKVIATFQGDYEWLGYVEKEFEIVPKSMTNNDISITIPEQTYTGSAIEPAVTVKDGETTLTLGTDYEVAYSNNVNAGTATVTITGKGNYSDSKEATFTISPRLARQAGAVYIYQDQNGMTALLDGTSLETVDIDFNHNIIVNHVTSNRVFTPGKPATVMLPFIYTCIGEEGGTFYRFVGVEKEENQPWVATMQETGNDTNSENTLIANTPYLFMPTATTMTFPNIPNGGVRLFTRGGSGGNCETAAPGSHWTFKGTYEYKEWQSGGANAEEIDRAYGFAGMATPGIEVGMFVKIASGAKIRPMCCYLLWSDIPNAANARALTRGAAATEEELPQRITVRLVGSNGEVTGIGSLDTKTGEMTFDSEAWYTMDGVRLSGKPTKKGLYINNGRKVVVKN